MPRKAKKKSSQTNKAEPGQEKKGLRPRQPGEKRAPPITKTKRAGLVLPVTRILNRMKKGRFAPRVGIGAAIYLTATIEYLCSELLDLAGNAATENHRKRITPRHIMMAVKHDDELSTLLKDVHISHGGVVPSVVQILLYTMKERRQAQMKNELPHDRDLEKKTVPSYLTRDIEIDDKKPKKKKRRSQSSKSTPPASSQQF